MGWQCGEYGVVVVKGEGSASASSGMVWVVAVIASALLRLELVQSQYGRSSPVALYRALLLSLSPYSPAALRLVSGGLSSCYAAPSGVVWLSLFRRLSASVDTKIRYALWIVRADNCPVSAFCAVRGVLSEVRSASILLVHFCCCWGS